MTPKASERDFDLIEVALESAADACQPGAVRGHSLRQIDPLAAEYLRALDAVRHLRTQSEPKEVFILQRFTPGEAVEIIGVYTDRDRALDKRRTKLMHNTPWREDGDGRWTTRPTDYIHNMYPYYTVLRKGVTS